MKADDARRLNDAYAKQQNLNTESIDQRIKQAASKGKVSVQISLDKIDATYRDRVYSGLKEHYTSEGFSLKRSKWSGDQREPQGYDYAIISW